MRKGGRGAGGEGEQVEWREVGRKGGRECGGGEEREREREKERVSECVREGKNSALTWREVEREREVGGGREKVEKD